MTKNKVKTGFAIATVVYAVFSVGTSSLAWPLIEAMGQNETLYEDTVDYIRIELAGVVFGSLSKFLLLVFVMHKWNAMLYLSLIAQMLTSSAFDYGLASAHGLNMGAIGIAYSSVFSKTLVFILNFAVVWIKLDFTYRGTVNIPQWRVAEGPAIFLLFYGGSPLIHILRGNTSFEGFNQHSLLSLVSA